MTRNETRAEPFRKVIVGAAAVVGLLHVLGALQVRDQVYRGYRTDDDRVVVEVNEGGPADRAGISAGDRLMSIDGVDAGDQAALDARPRPRVGQTQAVVVDRGGSTVEVQLILSGLPPIGVAAYLASGLTGLSFLAFGLWASFSAPSRTSRLLAFAGIGLGAVFTEQPNVASPFASALQESGLIVAAVFGFAALLHFMLVFPKARRMLSVKAALPAIYVPAAIVSAVKVAATVVQRGEPGGLLTESTTAALVLVLAYFFLAVVALVQSCTRATPAERAASGLNFLMACIVLGLAPMIPTAVHLVAPGVVFPGSDYYDLTWVLIPFAPARATVLQASREPAGTAGT
jgi:hypothetical protein